MKHRHPARTFGLGLLLSLIGACADPVTPDPPALPLAPAGPTAPTPAPPAATVGVLRVVTPGLSPGAQTGGSVRLRPCNATSCPFAAGVNYPQFVLSGAGSTELSVPVGSYAVDFVPPSGHLFTGADTGETMGALINGITLTTVTFPVAPMAER